MAMMWLMFLAMRDVARSRAKLHVELLAVRHQLHVLERTRPRRVRLSTLDRWLWVWLSRVWSDWRRAQVIVEPATGRRLAPARHSLVLDVEEPSPHGSPTGAAGGPGSDSHHVAGESAVGCAAHPR